MASRQRRQTALRETSLALGAVGVATAIGWTLRDLVSEADLVVLDLVAVVIVAVFLPRWSAILASAAAVLAFDFFFVPPLFTLRVADTRHVLTVAILFGVSLATSVTVARLRHDEARARSQEARTGALHALLKELAGGRDQGELRDAFLRHVNRVLATPGELTFRDEVDASGEHDSLDVARWFFASNASAGSVAPFAPQRIVCFPANGPGNEAIGVFAVTFGSVGDAEARDFVEASLRLLAQSLTRLELQANAQQSELRARTEAMRSALLSAVSHELRTPLAAITAASSLLAQAAAIPSEMRRAVALSVGEEARRLGRLLANLIDMTRLDAGAVAWQHELLPVEDVIASACERLEDRFGSRRLEVHVDDGLPLLEGDPTLLDVLFVNLLENAIKYTVDGSRLCIAAQEVSAGVGVVIEDDGPGIPIELRERIFEKFVRGAHPGVAGMGLGLPICRAIAEVHGGTIVLEPGRWGGARFRVTLRATRASLAPSVTEGSHVDR